METLLAVKMAVDAPSPAGSSCGRDFGFSTAFLGLLNHLSKKKIPPPAIAIVITEAAINQNNCFCSLEGLAALGLAVSIAADFVLLAVGICS